MEIESIRDMMDAGLVVVACGGGGIPVYPTEGHHLKGAAAVIDKDFAASCLAQQLDADFLIILTAVEKVAIGTSPNPLIKSTTAGLETQKWGGTIVNEETGLTSRDNVYAGGDAVTGAATVILVMGAGKTAAKAIHEALCK